MFFMEKNIKEFINPDGTTLISSKIPNIDPKTSAKKTTDASIPMRTQSYNYTIYNVKLQEKELEHSKKANEMAKEPQKFHEYLKSIGEGEKFEEYFEINESFVEKNEKNYESTLRGISRKKAYDVIENLLNNIDSENYTGKKTIEEVKTKEPMLVEKFVKMVEAIKTVMDEEDKQILLNYFKHNCK